MDRDCLVWFLCPRTITGQGMPAKGFPYPEEQHQLLPVLLPLEGTHGALCCSLDRDRPTRFIQQGIRRAPFATLTHLHSLLSKERDCMAPKYTPVVKLLKEGFLEALVRHLVQIGPKISACVVKTFCSVLRFLVATPCIDVLCVNGCACACVRACLLGERRKAHLLESLHLPTFPRHICTYARSFCKPCKPRRCAGPCT